MSNFCRERYRLGKALSTGINYKLLSEMGAYVEDEIAKNSAKLENKMNQAKVKLDLKSFYKDFKRKLIISMIFTAALF